MNETLLYAAILIPCLIIAIVFHEVAHGWAALALGDPTARDLKRLSFNPVRHVDPVGTLLVPGLLALAQGPIFGWAKPVPVMKNRLNNPRFGMMAVAAAGPAMNFFLAFVGAIVLGLLVGQTSETSPEMFGIFLQAIQTFILINVFLGMFNLLPIPPFDGSHIIEGLLPPKWAVEYQKLRPYGMMLFFGIVALSWFVPGLGIIENVIIPPVLWVQDFYLSIASLIAFG